MDKAFNFLFIGEIKEKVENCVQDAQGENLKVESELLSPNSKCPYLE